MPPVYLTDVLQPFSRDRRHRHAAAVEVPPCRQVHVWPRHRFTTRIQPVCLENMDVDAVAWRPLAWWPRRVLARRCPR
jgi:hypothetical protein